jgi:hypothetical protein
MRPMNSVELKRSRQQDAKEAAEDFSLLGLIADIRAAVGDNGKRMQPELVEHLRQMAVDAAMFRYLQSIDSKEAQAFFWNHSSRKERAKAIAAAMKGAEE